MISSDLRVQCEICKTNTLTDFQISSKPIDIESLTSSGFQVTNKDYGKAVETVKCSICGLIQPKYIINYKDVVKLYEAVQDDAYLQSAESRGKSNYKQTKNLINMYLPEAKSILEIGAGSGTMLKFLKEEYEVEGIEPNIEFCAFAQKEYGIKIHNTSFEEFTGTTYDVIVALDVIEHVVSPREFVSKIFSMLNPGGIVILGTPDVNSMSSRILRKKWYHIRPPHLFYFSKNTIKTLLESVSFRIIHIGNFVWSLPASYLVDSVQKLLFKRSFIKFPLKTMYVKVNFFDSKVYVAKKL